MLNNQDILNIINDTKTRFSPYLNVNLLDISINKVNAGVRDRIKYSEGFNISLKIILKESNIIDQIKKLGNFNVENISKKIHYFNPSLNGNINLEHKEASIHTVKIGLFTPNREHFTDQEEYMIENILGGKGLGALLVLMFTYICFKFNEYYGSNIIENITLDDSSSYPGWYGKLLFKYPDDDEVAELDLTPENFKKLQNKIYDYSKKGYLSKLDIFNKNIINESHENLNMLAEVALESRKQPQDSLQQSRKRQRIAGKSKRSRIGKKSKKIIRHKKSKKTRRAKKSKITRRAKKK